MNAWIWNAAVSALALLGAAGAASGQTSALKPVFTSEQAARGQAIYSASCTACHGLALTGGPGGPSVTGPAFLARWQGQGAGDLMTFLRERMPPGAPGSLSAAEYADVMA